MSPSNTTAIGAFLLEAYFYGIYTIIFSCAMCLIWNRRYISGAGSSIMLVGWTLCFIFILATAHMATSLCRLFLNVVTASSMSGPYKFLQGDALALSIASKTIWVTIMIVSDSLVIWRCWVLWERKIWMIPLFVILEVSFAACCIGHNITASRSANAMTDPVVIAWFTCLCITSFLTNVLASGLICLRLFLAQGQISKTIGQAHAVKIRSILWTYLESGSIYPTVTILMLGLYLAGSPYGWFFTIISPQICGMMPTLMVLVVLYEGQSLFDGHTAIATNSFSMRVRHSPRNYVDQFVASEILSHSGLEPGLEIHVQKEEHQSAKTNSPHVRILSTYDQI